MLNSLYCKRMTSNFLGFKVLATAQWNLNDLKNAQVSFMDLPCRKAGILKCHQKRLIFQITCTLLTLWAIHMNVVECFLFFS